MADTAQTLALVTLAQNFRGDIVRQINRRTMLLRLLPIVKGAGQNVAFVPEADGALAENYADGADAANFGSDAQASATLAWGLHRSNFHVTGLAMAAAASSGTPLGNLALWARNQINGAAKLASIVNKACFNGAGTGTTIFGLDGAIGSTTNVYATIDRNVGGNAFFRPTVVDPGVLTAPTFALIRDDIRQIYEASGENPDIAVCSPAVFNKVGSLFDATRRQVDQVMTARGPIKLDFGFQALEVDGTLFVKDKDATANQIYYINTNHVRIEYLPPVLPPGVADMPILANDGFGTVPLGMTYEMIAKLGDSERASAKTYCQLVVDKPSSCGVRKNVSTT
ncbi:MAG TPA: phage major capsid protein [Kofleriaceae bacterium]